MLSVLCTLLLAIPCPLCAPHCPHTACCFPHVRARSAHSNVRYPLSALRTRTVARALCSCSLLSAQSSLPSLLAALGTPLSARRSHSLLSTHAHAALPSPHATPHAARRTPPRARAHMLASAHPGTRTCRSADSSRRAWRLPAWPYHASRSPTSRWLRPSAGVAMRAPRCAPSLASRAIAAACSSSRTWSPSTCTL